jgi:AcrR family transcriptional regulator
MPGVVSMPRRSQQERTRATQQALLDTARRLFAERGYAHVPADEIVAAAGVTRGALYHHFDDKQALFEAVFEQLEGEIAAAITAATAQAGGGGWPAVAAGLGQFLDLCERPEIRQIALTDAPAVLGWAKWREIETRHGLGLIVDLLHSLAATGDLLSTAPVPVLAQLALSAVIEAALLIAHAADPVAARADAQAALLTLLSGMIRAG